MFFNKWATAAQFADSGLWSLCSSVSFPLNDFLFAVFFCCGLLLLFFVAHPPERFVPKLGTESQGAETTWNDMKTFMQFLLSQTVTVSTSSLNQGHLLDACFYTEWMTSLIEFHTDIILNTLLTINDSISSMLMTVGSVGFLLLYYTC